MEILKPYKNKSEISYTLGAFPTIELIACHKESVQAVYVHSSFQDKEIITKSCEKSKIPVIESDKTITRLSDKENVFVIGAFQKYSSALSAEKSHIVLVNPSNMGNLGTILRIAAGFGIYDIAVIKPAADIFHPKVVRSSMGALFRLRHEYFDSFEEYRQKYTAQQVFTFMLDGEKTLTIDACPKPDLFALVFGNEATGLDASYQEAGTSIMIPQSQDVDSLNLTIAVGIAAYLFSDYSRQG